MIELLVVMAIISMLAGLAAGPITRVLRDARVARDLSRLRAVGLACHQYAMDWGMYPRGNSSPDESLPPTANEAFRPLFDGYLEPEDEMLFNVYGLLKLPDQRVGTRADGFAKALESGENGYCYFAGYKAEDRGPLAWTPTASGLRHTAEDGWVADRSLPQVYGGQAVNVVFTDGSAQTLKGSGPYHLRGVGTEHLPLRALSPAR